MSSTSIKTLPKRIATKHKGIYYKEIQQTTIDDHGKIKTKIIDKVYVIRYRDGKKQHFVTIGKYSEGIRESYCKTKLDGYVTIARNGELPPQVEKRIKKEVITLDDLAMVYFLDKEAGNETNIKQLQKYNLYLGHIEPIGINSEYGGDNKGKGKIKVSSEGRNGLGNKDIHSIIKEDISRLQNALKAKGKAPKTINGVMQLLSAVINHSIEEKDLTLINPCVGVKRLKTDDERQRYLSLEEVKQLIDEVKDNTAVYHFVKLALTTGARLEGVLHIQKKNINISNNSVTLTDLKSGGTYTGYYDDEYKAELEEYVDHLKADDYLIGGKDKLMAGRTIRGWLKPILDRLFNQGLETNDSKNRVVIHTLRHTFASQLAINGVPIYTIQKLINHAKIEMTLRYAKLAPDQGKDAVKGLFK